AACGLGALVALPLAMPLPFLCIRVPSCQHVQDACIAQPDILADISGDKSPANPRARSVQFRNQAILNKRLVTADLIPRDMDPIARARFQLLDGLANLLDRCGSLRWQ